MSHDTRQHHASQWSRVPAIAVHLVDMRVSAHTSAAKFRPPGLAPLMGMECLQAQSWIYT